MKQTTICNIYYDNIDSQWNENILKSNDLMIHPPPHLYVKYFILVHHDKKGLKLETTYLLFMNALRL